MRRSSVFFIIGFIVLLTITTGVVPAASEEITLMAQPGPEALAYAKVADIYLKETGVKVNVATVGRDNYDSRVEPQLMSGTDAFDIIYLTNDRMPGLAAGGFLEPLDKYMTAKVKVKMSLNDVFPSALASSKFNGKVYGLPTDASTLLLFYRKDLINNPPQTWDEFVTVAKQWTKSHNPKSPTTFGGSLQGNVTMLTKSVMSNGWALGGDLIDVKKRKVVVNSPKVTKVLQMTVDMVNKDKIIPPDTLSWGYMEMVGGLQEEVVAMALQWNAAYNTYTDQKQSPKIWDKIGVTSAPGWMVNGKVKRGPYMNSILLCINPNSKHKQAAFNFMAWASGKEGGKLYTEAGGFSPRRSVLQNLKDPTIAPFMDSMMVAHPFPAIKEWPQIDTILTRSLSEAVSGERTVADALKNAEQQSTKVLSGK